MENVIALDLLNILYSFDISRLFLTIIIVFIGQLVDETVVRGRRDKITLKQRELYYQKLTNEYLKMESEKLDNELKMIQKIDALDKEKREYLNSTDSDWSGDADTRRISTSEEELDERTSSDRVSDELNDYEAKARELQLINKDIGKIAQDINESNIEEVKDPLALSDATQELNAKIQQLEMHNDQLKAQIARHANQLLMPKKESDLDPSILQFIERHQDVLTLDFLEKAYQTLVELKASDQGRDFNEYMSDLKSVHMNYAAKLTELNVAKKEVEIKLKVMKQRYQEEMASFNEVKLEHAFKSSGVNEHLTALKEKNTILSDIISNLKTELETKKSDIALWRERYREAEEQCSVYYQFWKDSQMKVVKLEAETGAPVLPNRSGMISMSSASSFVDHQVPPAPPIDLPTADELLRAPPMNNMYGLPQSQAMPRPPSIKSPMDGSIDQSTCSSGLRFR